MYLSARDVADMLGVSLRTAQRRMKTMRHIVVGIGQKRQTLRVSKEDLDALFVDSIRSDHVSASIQARSRTITVRETPKDTKMPRR